MGALLWRILSLIGRVLMVLFGIVITFLAVRALWAEVWPAVWRSYHEHSQQYLAAVEIKQTDLGLIINGAETQPKSKFLEAIDVRRREAKTIVAQLAHDEEAAVRGKIATLKRKQGVLDRELARAPYQPSFQPFDITDPQDAIRREAQRVVDNQVTIARLNTEREIVTAELLFAKSLLSALSYEKQCAFETSRLPGFQQKMERATNALRKFAAQKSYTVAQVRELRRVTAVVQSLTKQLAQRAKAVKECNKEIKKPQRNLQHDPSETLQKLDSIDLNKALNKSLSESNAVMQAGLNEWETAIQASLKSDWVGRFVVSPLITSGWGLVAMILGWFLAPPLWRLVKFAAASVAQRRTFPPLCAEANGGERLLSTGTSIDVPLDERSELVVRPQGYVQSLPEGCDEQTRWVFSKRSWRASVSAHLDTLASIRARTSGVACLSAGNDGLSYLASIDVPSGAAISVRPSQIVGVLKPLDSELIFERAKRYWHLHSWLRKQWHYYVLHGPVTLIVKGCGGVKAATVAKGGSQPDLLTLGFSANLEYGIEPTGYFWGYIRGEVPLLRTRFRGVRGIFVFEERADFKKNRPITASALGPAQNIADIATKAVTG